MKLEWMGQYRSFVEALVKFGNVWSQAYDKGIIKSTIPLSAPELQVLEYTLENEELHQKMAQIAQRLYIPQSSFSKIVKQLTEKGLMEKYRVKGNNKDVIVKVSDKGREVYEVYAKGAVEGKWGAMFKKLDKLKPKDIEIITEMLDEFSDSQISQNIPDPTEPDEPEELIKIE